MTEGAMRLDRFLWFVRLAKTRTDLVKAARVIRAFGIAFADKNTQVRNDRVVAQREGSIADVDADAIRDRLSFENPGGHGRYAGSVACSAFTTATSDTMPI